MAEKIAGIIGGMGPKATLEFMDRLLAATPANDDGDHLRLLLDSNPKVPSRIAALIEKTGEDPANVLCAMAKGLEKQGADFLVMICNTAHFYLPQIARSVKIPMLDMVALASAKVKSQNPGSKCVGLLASPAVRLMGVYESALNNAGLNPLFPSAAEEESLLAIIRAVKAGRDDEQDLRNYAQIAQKLVDEGADSILVACTELSILDLPHRFCHCTVDALDALVEATIRTARDS